MPFSQTYVAVIVTLLVSVSSILGIDLEEGSATEFVSALLIVLSGLWALYGRWKAGGLKWWGGRK